MGKGAENKAKRRTKSNNKTPLPLRLSFQQPQNLIKVSQRYVSAYTLCAKRRRSGSTSAFYFMRQWQNSALPFWQRWKLSLKVSDPHSGFVFSVDRWCRRSSCSMWTRKSEPSISSHLPIKTDTAIIGSRSSTTIPHGTSSNVLRVKSQKLDRQEQNQNDQLRKHDQITAD